MKIFYVFYYDSFLASSTNCYCRVGRYRDYGLALYSRNVFLLEFVIGRRFTMVVRIKRAIDIAMSNYIEIVGFCVFTYEERVAYASDNMDISSDISTILQAWKGQYNQFSSKGLSFIIALATSQGFVAINPEGAISLICGTGKGVWFVAVYAPMDSDKEGILRECIQTAKNLEASVSIFDV